MPEPLAVLLILWAVAAFFGLLIGSVIRLMMGRDERNEIRAAYLIMLSGLTAPVAVPFWIGYGIRAAILDYRRNAAELRELEADPEPDDRPQSRFPDPFRRP